MKKLWHRFVVCTFVAASLQMYGWGLTGHRIVAEIAENNLNARAKRHLKKILGKESMAYWANWPDFIKSDTTGVWKSTYTWHYVNIDPQPDFDTFKSVLFAQPAPTLYTQIKKLSEQIKHKKTSLQDKKIALIFLIHIMGDMVQPMHVGRAGDLGGNKITVSYFGKNTNLHSVWDEGLIDSLKYSYTEFARLLDIRSRAEIRKIQSGTLEEWLYENHRLANRIYADTPVGSKLSYAYGYKYDKILEEQLLKGGLRLAKILNELL
ncbi:S1/P1 Nuclease [Elizabethkingia argentiflava]|uniref:S1/P1 Nuclease n=1 Tax=Elizabethkingia argenteiflava TaxID=2681556 RepID=A0A845PUI0_9FLAO|nr:S1/P1 nuclease [Elizabethkingia argenteiflava]NAW51869.1 S1/P1 Nuclease [Elizabethkingia argenteiflava]